jgi:hypothetical protein
MGHFDDSDTFSVSIGVCLSKPTPDVVLQQKSPARGSAGYPRVIKRIPKELRSIQKQMNNNMDF